MGGTEEWDDGTIEGTRINDVLNRHARIAGVASSVEEAVRRPSVDEVIITRDGSLDRFWVRLEGDDVGEEVREADAVNSGRTERDLIDGVVSYRHGVCECATESVDGCVVEMEGDGLIEWIGKSPVVKDDVVG